MWWFGEAKGAFRERGEGGSLFVSCVAWAVEAGISRKVERRNSLGESRAEWRVDGVEREEDKSRQGEGKFAYRKGGAQ